MGRVASSDGHISVNLSSHGRPAFHGYGYDATSRRLERREYAQAVRGAIGVGLTNLAVQ